MATLTQGVHTLHLDDRYVTVTAPAKALAFEVETHGRNLALEIAGRFATPHCLARAKRRIAEMRELLDTLEEEL